MGKHLKGSNAVLKEILSHHLPRGQKSQRGCCIRQIPQPSHALVPNAEDKIYLVIGSLTQHRQDWKGLMPMLYHRVFYSSCNPKCKAKYTKRGSRISWFAYWPL